MRRWVCGPRLGLGLTFNGFRVSSQPVGSWPETGFEEISPKPTSGDLAQNTVGAGTLVAERPRTNHPNIDAYGTQQGCVTAKRAMGIRMQNAGRLPSRARLWKLDPQLQIRGRTEE
jgi:hypothetical protein